MFFFKDNEMSYDQEDQKPDYFADKKFKMKEVMQLTEEDVAAAIQAANKSLLVDLPIARKKLTNESLFVPNLKAFVEAQTKYAKLKKLR